MHPKQEGLSCVKKNKITWDVGVTPKNGDARAKRIYILFPGRGIHIEAGGQVYAWQQ